MEPISTPLVVRLRREIASLETETERLRDKVTVLEADLTEAQRQNIDFVRQNNELREAVAALLQPAQSESANFTHQSESGSSTH